MKDVKQLRETWLNRIAKALEPKFKTLGHKLPAYRASCGFPSSGRKGKAIGECWASQCSKDKTHEIFIHPGCADTLEVAGILCHEMVHAAVGLDKHHGPAFRKVAVAMGLTGKMKSTVPGDGFKALIAPIIKRVGKYPHAALEVGFGVSSRAPKQSTRLHKAFCPDCDYTVRVTSKWVDVSAPVCPNPDCSNFQGEMTVA